MGQQRLDRNNNEDDVVRIARIDANFDDVFDIAQVLSADYTFVSTIAAQKLLNGSPNGALNLPVGLFEFDCMFFMTGLSTASSTFGFALGGTATIDSQAWQATANKAVHGTQANGQSTYNTTANAALTASTTTTEGWAYLCGVFRLSAAGTIIPQVTFSSVSGGTISTVTKNSFFRCKKLSQNFKAALIAPPLPLPSPNVPFWS